MSIQYAMGGLNMMPNAEVEKQENSIAPDGTFTQYDGKSHANGGIQTYLEPGEMIFSDKLKPSGSKKTYAQLNKLYNTNKEDKVLEDNKANNVKKLTAQLIKDAKLKQSMALFQAQEDHKRDKVNNYAKRMGIPMPMSEANETTEESQFSGGGKMPINLLKSRLEAHMSPEEVNSYIANYEMGGMSEDIDYNYASGGIHINPKNKGKFNATKKATGKTTEELTHSKNPLTRKRAIFAQNAAKWHHEMGGLQKFLPGGVNGDGLDENGDPIFTPTTKTLEQRQHWQQSQGFNPTEGYDPNAGVNPNYAKLGKAAGQIALGLAQNAGNIYDIYRSKKADTLNLQRYTPTLMNPSADLAANLRMYQDAKAQTAEASQGNASTYLNNMAAARAAKLNRDYATNMNYSNVNTGLMNEAAQYNAGQMDKEALFKLQSEAAARNLRASGISNIGQNAMMQYRGQNAEKNQNTYLNILAKKYPELMKDKDLSGLFNTNQ
jgi:hypothetical protein